MGTSRNANSFPDGRRGRPGPNDLGRVAEYTQRTLPVAGPGMFGRTFPSGSVLTPRPSRRRGGNGSTDDAPWKLYPSPWTGTGTDPRASERAYLYEVMRGKWASRTPSNPNDVFKLFGSLADLSTTKTSGAVWTQFYLKCPWSESALGKADYDYPRPEIKIIQGDDLIEALGSTLPQRGDDGALPTWVAVPIGEAGIWAGAVHISPQPKNWLAPIVVSTNGCSLLGRNLSIVSSS